MAYKKVVFVCTGNICRSPALHYIANRWFPNVEFDSCGIGKTASKNALMDKMTREAVKNIMGMEVTHRSQPIKDMDPETSLFITVSNYHTRRLKTDYGLESISIEEEYLKIQDPHFNRNIEYHEEVVKNMFIFIKGYLPDILRNKKLI